MYKLKISDYQLLLVELVKQTNSTLIYKNNPYYNSMDKLNYDLLPKRLKTKTKTELNSTHMLNISYCLKKQQENVFKINSIFFNILKNVEIDEKEEYFLFQNKIDFQYFQIFMYFKPINSSLYDQSFFKKLFKKHYIENEIIPYSNNYNIPNISMANKFFLFHKNDENEIIVNNKEYINYLDFFILDNNQLILLDFDIIYNNVLIKFNNNIFYNYLKINYKSEYDDLNINIKEIIRKKIIKINKILKLGIV